MAKRLIGIEEVCRKTSLSRETIRRWEKDGHFPKRIILSRYPEGSAGLLYVKGRTHSTLKLPARVAWLESDVDSWIQERIGKPANDNDPV